MDKFGRRKQMTVFSPAICQKAKVLIRTAIREILIPRRTVDTLEWFAKQLNPKIRGWINYYCKFNKYETHEVFYYLNHLIRKWIKNKFKIRSKKARDSKYHSILSAQPMLFYHWRLGLKA